MTRGRAHIGDVRRYPDWRPGVLIEEVVEGPGAVRFTEVSGGERIACELTESEPDAVFVSTLTDPTTLPFGGAWHIALSAESGEYPRAHPRRRRGAAPFTGSSPASCSATPRR
ncbi:MAG: hypothetical protein R2712_08435 [Vicinamibacterales bacterium]